MLQIKFQGHRSISYRMEDFLKIFTIYERGEHIDHVTGRFENIFVPSALGQRSNNDLDLLYSQISMYSNYQF